MPGKNQQGNAAQGTVLLMAAQIIFLISGYAINILLALELSHQEYAKFGVVMATLIWVELFVINGIPTVMQRFIPSGRYPVAALVRAGFKSQMLYALVVFIVFMLMSPVISRSVFRDATLAPLLQIAAIDIIIYGMYWLATGVLSGQKLFAAQALGITAYALGKLGGVAVLIYAGFGVYGALIGNWLGSAVGLLAALALIRIEKPDRTTRVSMKEFRQFVFSIVLFTITINLMLNLDLFFVKRYLEEIHVAFYYNASTLARIPYIVFLAISFTLLPVLSQSITAGATEKAQEQIRQVIRFLVILLVPIVLFIWQNATAIIRLLYTEKFDPAASILPMLTLGLAVFTLFYTTTTIMNADNRPGLAFTVALTAVAVDAAANFFLVPVQGTFGAAAATTVASVSGLLVGSAWVLHRFKTFFSLGSVLRVTAAAGFGYAILSGWHATPVLVIPKFFVFFGLYALTLIGLQEIKIEEFRLLLGRGQKNVPAVESNVLFNIRRKSE